jgi:hypothetical protein
VIGSIWFVSFLCIVSIWFVNFLCSGSICMVDYLIMLVHMFCLIRIVSTALGPCA